MRKIGNVLIGVVVFALGCVCAADPAKVALVEKGELKEAKASWWGFDPQDSTKFLQAAIHSKVPKLIIDKQASPWISGPLFAVSDQTIVFEDGAELQAKRGLFQKYDECLLRMENVKNTALIGLGGGGVMSMHKKEYQDKSKYEHSEHRHTFKCCFCKNVRIENMKFLSSGGDGIYLRGVENVRVKNVLCDDNHRQGMSIICGRDILVEESEFNRTGGTDPQCGLDIEPNHGDEELRNIVFRNCRFAGNANWGILLCLAHFDSHRAGKLDLRFENCLTEGNRKGEIVSICDSFHKDIPPVQGRIEFVGCKAVNRPGSPHSAVSFISDVCHEVDVVLKDLTVRQGGGKNALRFVFRNPRKPGAKPMSKITLDDVKFPDCSAGDALKLVDATGSGRIDNFSGSIVDREGRRTPVGTVLSDAQKAASGKGK